MKLVDTSVAVDYLRGRREAIQLLNHLVDDQAAVASEVTRFELIAGVRAHETAALTAFVEQIDWIPVGKEVSGAGGLLSQNYRRRFEAIDEMDYLIAATAIVYDLDLLTRNVKHFPMLDVRAPY